MEANKIVGVCDEDPFDALTWSGSSSYFFRALEKRGILAGAVSSEPGYIKKKLIQAKCFQLTIEKWRFSYSLSPLLFRARTEEALKNIKKKNIDCDIFLQIGAWFDFTSKGKPVISYHDGNLARRLDSPYQVPCINSKRTDEALEYERVLYSKIDIIFPMSEWLKRSFINDFSVDERKIHAVYAGINMPDNYEFTPATYSSKNIIFVGKDFKRKGGQILLEAFDIVKQKIPDATLTIIGPTLDNLPRGVINPGFISKSQPEGLARLKQYYRESSVFVLPTLYEPFGIAFAEAMAHGLPCVGTDICAIPEIITDGETGYVIPPQNTKALASRLIELLRDPALCESMGRAGFSRYRSDFNWDAVVDKMYSEIKKIKKESS